MILESRVLFGLFDFAKKPSPLFCKGLQSFAKLNDLAGVG